MIEHLDDFKRLLLADTHFIDLLIEVDFKVILVANRARLGLDGLQVVFLVLVEHQRDVLCGSEYVNQLEMLVDHADAVRIGVLGIADFNGLPADEDFTGVGIVDAGDHIHQRRFAAAVFAEKGEDFALAHAERNVVVRDYAAERLGDMAQFNGVFHVWLLTPILVKNREKGSGKLLPFSQ